MRQLREWVEREVHLDLTNAPFDPHDESLLSFAGTCAKCPKRTGNNPLLFPEVRQKSICTDRTCSQLNRLIRVFFTIGDFFCRAANFSAFSRSM